MPDPVRKRLLFDWHIPSFLADPHLDVPAYLAAVDRMRPDTILLMAKTAFGGTTYDDAYGHHIPGLQQDLFADLVGPLHERGVEVVAYLNITLNDVVAAEHPEWHQVDPDGTPVIKFDYHQLCMNSPYRDMIMGMMADLAGKYPVDGLWFDITYVHEPGCFCAYCREAYAAETGEPLTPAVGQVRPLRPAFTPFAGTPAGGSSRTPSRVRGPCGRRCALGGTTPATRSSPRSRRIAPPTGSRWSSIRRPLREAASTPG